MQTRGVILALKNIGCNQNDVLIPKLLLFFICLFLVKQVNLFGN